MKVSEHIARWRDNPVQFVHEMFGVEPDKWQRDALEILADPSKQRISLQACSGPGKSTVLAWAGWYFLVCMGEKGEHPKGAAMSITGDNLRDNLWSELSKWQSRSEYLRRMYVWNSEKIYAKDHPQTWFLSARSFSKTANAEEQGRTLSGLHSKYVLYLIDESGDISPAVLRAAEQGLSGVKWGKILQAGNPTSHDGMLYAAATILRDQWHVICITSDPDDPNRTPRVEIEWARNQINTYSRSNPWVMSYILGKFPPSSLNTLLGPDEVNAAINRHLRIDQYSFSQKRLGVDVARFGDDRSVIFPRQGLASFKPVVMRSARTPEIAARVAQAKVKWKSEMEMVDGTGGYGSGVIDSLLQAGYAPLEIQFAGKAIDPRYANKRAEMWFEMAEWIKRGGALPNMPEMVKELTAPTYTFSNGKFLLESKDQIKKRLGFSPDCFTAGTFISTPDGDKRIETMKVGDEVLTPYGKSKVIKVWETEANKLTTAKFSDGRVLIGKGKHEIFTWDKGWVRLDSLSLTNVFETICKRKYWLLKNLFSTKKKDLEFKHQVDIINQTKGAMVRKDFYIGECGLTYMEKYLKGIISTIKTMIGQTIQLRTSNLCMEKNTNESICLNDLKMNHLDKKTQRYFWKLKTKQENGTEARKVWLGINSMGRNRGTIENNSNLNVLFVRRQQWLGQKLKGFVLDRVNKSKGIRDIKQVLVNACCVIKNLFLTSIGHKNVVLDYVQTDCVKSEKTYNLTLDKDNVYYANGILVSNCADALALTFALPDMPASDPLRELAEVSRKKHQAEYDPFAPERL